MWLKEENDKLIPPPPVYKLADGWTIINMSQSPELMRQHGWRDWTDEEIEEWKEAHPVPVPPLTVDDYDRSVEDHLLAERIDRGYTTREPSDYAGSSVPRWAQDAADWIAHRDAVMLYALEIMTRYAETGEAPTLEDFRAALPVIAWTAQDESPAAPEEVADGAAEEEPAAEEDAEKAGNSAEEADDAQID